MAEPTVTTRGHEKWLVDAVPPLVAVGMLRGKWTANYVDISGRKTKIFDGLTNLDQLVAFLEIILSHEDSRTPSFMMIHCPNDAQTRVQSFGW